MAIGKDGAAMARTIGMATVVAGAVGLSIGTAQAATTDPAVNFAGSNSTFAGTAMARTPASPAAATP